MAKVCRPWAIVAQWLGIAMLIPGLLRVPLPQADFHVIRHHHGEGEDCPRHNHLLRWHPEAGDSEAEAVLHWHWFLPQCLDMALSGEHLGDNPVLHAHNAEDLQCFWSPSSATLVDARDGGPGRLGPASPLDWAWIDVPRVAPPLPWSAEGRPAPWVEQGDASLLARLVRWNC